LFAPITKWAGTVKCADEIAPTIERAFLELRSGRPGPVMVDVPADVLSGPAEGKIPALVVPERPAAAAADVERAVQLLCSVKSRLLLANDGVLHYGAWRDLGELAERLGAPVITRIKGKSCLAEEHPCSLGDMNSPAGQAAYPLADSVFTVGSRFAQTDIRWP